MKKYSVEVEKIGKDENCYIIFVEDKSWQGKAVVTFTKTRDFHVLKNPIPFLTDYALLALAELAFNMDEKTKITFKWI